MYKALFLYCLLFCSFSCSSLVGQSLDLLKGINSETKFNNQGVVTNLTNKEDNKVLHIHSNNSVTNKYNWTGIPIITNKRLSAFKYIVAKVNNSGDDTLKVLFWVNSSNGWNSVADEMIIAPRTTVNFKCNLREQFPDGTFKLNPNYINQVQLMFVKADEVIDVQIESLQAYGRIDKWKRPENRLDVPMAIKSKPKAGKRFFHKLDQNSNLYSVVYLPKNWGVNNKKKYPVIVEFPGNIYYTRQCYSTGRPEDCVMGYGMSKGENAIWISMPFVNYNKNSIAESGWGNPDDTADYTVKTVKHIVENFGGDIDNIVLTGFSRGAIACGFIGLRNNTIASLWKGIHACQHYDGDGWGGANKVGAEERLKRLKNIQVFQTDNNKEELKEILAKVNANVIYESSGLKAHACDMFLDHRPSTIALREWFMRLSLD